MTAQQARKPASPRQRTASAKPPKLTVAAQLYTLRDFLKTPADMQKTFKRIRKMGYQAAQISGVGPIDPADLRAMMLDCGVNPIGAHVPLGQFRDDPAKVIALCQAWGIRYVAIPSLPADAATTPAAWRKLGREFSGYGKILAAAGIILQYHNHAFEFQKYGLKGGRGGTTGLDLLYAAADPKFLQAELDFGWVMRGNQDPIEWAKKMKGRLDQVHLKDWGILRNEPVWRAIGEGSSNWPAIIAACKQSGTRYFLIEQDSCPVTGNPFTSLGISLDYLREIKLVQ